MKSNAILCVLNRVFLQSNQEIGAAQLTRQESYYSADLKMSFTGIQANEAPVKMLLQEAHAAGQAITEVLYLCSAQCSEPSIPASTLAGMEEFAGITDEAISAEDFFIERIAAFCKEQNIKAPVFNPIPYSPSRPADCLPTLIQYLGKAFSVSIDITGGRRDAVILETLAAQLLKVQSSANSVNSIVYASFDDKTIARQNTTFDLVELTGAIDAFLTYGQTNQIKQFFESRRYISSETLKLCQEMSAFSDALSLCQIDDIDQKVKAIQDAMTTIEAALSTKFRYYDLIADALKALDDPDGWICEVDLEEALENIKAAELPIDTETEDEAELRERLEAARWSYIVVRSEILLYSLLPIMRERFISTTDSSDLLILNTIKWCTEHQMLQQALCIYRERISEVLVDLGFFWPTLQYERLTSQAQKSLLQDLCAVCQIGEQRDSRKGVYFRDDPTRDDYNHYFTFDQIKYDSLLTIVAWYHYLHGVRNMVMHLSSHQGTKPYMFACAFLEINPEASLKPKELENHILSALKAIESPAPANRAAWNRACRTAQLNADGERRAPSKQDRSPNAHVSTHNTPKFPRQSEPKIKKKLKEVSSAPQLQLLIFEYSSGDKTVEWAQFERWCAETKGIRLSKSSLALDEGIPYHQGVCEKYPDKFRLEERDGTVFITTR